MNRDEVIAWIQGFEAAREAERALTRKEPVDPARSLALGLSLIELARCHAAEIGRGRAGDEEVRIVRECWAKLRRAIDS